MNVLFTINKEQAEHVCVLISSLRNHTDLNEPLNIYVIHTNLDDDDIIKLRKSAKNICITFIGEDLNYFISAEPSDFPVDYNKYVRAFAYMLLPKSINRILYLSYDTLVINNISNFYESDFKDKAIIGCQLPILAKNSSNKSYLGLTDKDYFIDTGVMLMNLSFMRAVDFSEKMINFISSFDDVNRPDEQCIINLFYKDFIKNINYLVYNLGQSSLDLFNKNNSLIKYNLPLKAIKEYSAILHFYDDEKPWMDTYDFSLKKLYKDAYNNYLSNHKINS